MLILFTAELSSKLKTYYIILFWIKIKFIIKIKELSNLNTYRVDAGFKCTAVNRVDTGFKCTAVNRVDTGFKCTAVNRVHTGFKCTAVNRACPFLHYG